MSCSILNRYEGIMHSSYLELGIFDGSNFHSINSSDKYSVDINGNAMFTGTTDEYFKQLDINKKFDFIFIDANHDYDYVLRDYNHSVKHCTKYILIHDMIPPCEDDTHTTKCSDSYKLLQYFVDNNFPVYPMDENFGLSFIKMPATIATPDELYKTYNYSDFMNNISSGKIKLYSANFIESLLNDKL